MRNVRIPHRSGSPGAGTAPIAALLVGLALCPARAAENRYLTGVPDYEWNFGCFGTACGNLMGYWDRHGFPNFYTGPTGGGLAPLNSFGANTGIRSLWASEAGFDGRAANKPGHVDDYYDFYEGTNRDPYARAGRAEHTPDCLGDFIGLNQDKWPDLAGECSGNIDGFSFNFWDTTGHRRENYTPAPIAGAAVPDIQSGLRTWTAFRGYTADSFSQLAEFNPDKTGTEGFTFADLKAEIDAGYPVLLFMQPYGEFSRMVNGKAGTNPEIHGMLAYGYVIDDAGNNYVRYRTSWASGDREFSPWTCDNWTPENSLFLPVRGVIGFHPRPRITKVEPVAGGLKISWYGPLGTLREDPAGSETPAQLYVVEKASSLADPRWEAVAGPEPALTVTLPSCCGDGAAFFRLRMVPGGGS